MRWYVRDRIAGQPRQAWLFDGHTATRQGASRNVPDSHFEANPDEDFIACIRRQTSWLDDGAAEGSFYLMTLGPGELYSRIARPHAYATRDDLWYPWLELEQAYVAEAGTQLTVLTRKLESICQTVQPVPETLEVYGHEIRNLLILASTEFEMHCRGVLKKNNYSGTLNSNAYAQLANPMKLRDFTVAFRKFPALSPVRPFAGWLSTTPSVSLPWYAAYNGTKHNREEEFKLSTLRNTFAAVSACVVLFVAQFGPAAMSAELSTLVRLEV